MSIKIFHGLIIVFGVLALPVKAEEQDYLFNIPRQPADGALTALAIQADITVAFDNNLVHLYQTNPIYGVYSVREAVTEILKGTLLEFELGDSQNLIITEAIPGKGLETIIEPLNRAGESGFLDGLFGRIFGSGAESTGEEPQARGASPTDSIPSIEEILVTGRKREERLVDVPVSISVLNAAMLQEQGFTSQKDLFDAVLSLNYDTALSDRNSSQPGVRGVQSNEVATAQQKVNSFIDGVPMIGQIGSLSFSGIDQVEVYRGPQSAAFGRSTFAGAINYVTADASEEFEAKLRVRTSSLASNELGVAISGPINDSLGYLLSYIKDEFTGPSEWTATDGTKLGAQESSTLTAKLNFEINDAVYGELMFTRLDQDDAPGVNWTLDPLDCSGDSGISFNAMAARTELFSGEWDCDIYSDVPRRNHDVYDTFVEQYDAASYGGLSLDAYLAQTDALGVTYQQLLLGQTIDPAVQVERDRYQGELNFDIGNNLLTLLAMKSTEFYQRWAGANNDSNAFFDSAGMLAANLSHRADPTDIDETYFEMRWASPAEDKLRYTLSGSYYSYDFRTDVFGRFGAISYDLLHETTGEPIDPLNLFIIANSTENLGASFGMQYDLADRTTLSFEGRYQKDENCGKDTALNLSACTSTNSFAPRIAINTSLSDTSSIYAQVSRGTNPAGINIIYADPNIALALDIANGSVAVPEIAPDGISLPSNAGLTYNDSSLFNPSVVSYSADNWLSYGEETLTNYEIGAKGTFADDRGSFTAALYYMHWKDLLNVLNLDWNDDSAIADGDNYNGWNYQGYWNAYDGYRTTLNAGNAVFYGLELSSSYALDSIWTVGGNLTLSSNKYDDYCSILGQAYTTSTESFTQVFDVLTPEEDGVLSDCAPADGNDMPKSSRVKGSFDISAALPQNILGMHTTLRADVLYSGTHSIDDFNLIKRSSVSTLNLSANMRSDRLTLRLFVNNLTDNDEPLNLSITNKYTDSPTLGADPQSSSAYAITPQRPRELGVSLAYEF